MFSIADVLAEEDDIEEELENDSESDSEDSPVPFHVRASLSITKVLSFCDYIVPININHLHSWHHHRYSLTAQERLTST